MLLELFLPAVCCDECKKATYTPVWVTRHIGRGTVQLAFCSKAHADAFYMKRNHAKIGEDYVPEL